MPFPTTGIITSFAGADADPISEGGTWGGVVGAGYSAAVRVASNQGAGSGSGAQSGYRSAATYTETEVYATVPVLPNSGQEVILFGRITSPGGASVRGYMLIWNGNGNWDWIRIYNGGQYYVGATPFLTQAISAGDSIGMEITGVGAAVTLKAFHGSGGVWNQIGSNVEDTDANRQVAAGYLGFGGSDSTWRIDDLGGGERVAAGVPRFSAKNFPNPKLR